MQKWVESFPPKMECCGIYTEHLTFKLIFLVKRNFGVSAVAQLVEHRTKFARSRVRFPAGWPKVAFFAGDPGLVLKSFRRSKISIHQKHRLLEMPLKVETFENGDF